MTHTAEQIERVAQDLWNATTSIGGLHWGDMPTHYKDDFKAMAR